MAYIIVTGYDNKAKSCAVATLTEDNNLNITGTSVVSVDDLGKLVVSKNLKPLNFTVDRTGKAKQDVGSFSRFHAEGVYIALAYIKTKSGRGLGYRLLNTKTGVIENKKIAELVALEAQAKRPIIQNAVIRNNTVNAYPLFVFPTITVGTEQPKQSKAKATKVKVKSMKFTSEQLAEIENCKSNGGNVALISNAAYTPEQMRVLWQAKKDGALVIVFSNPKLSADQMRFFADRVKDKHTASDCMLMAKHPEITVRGYEELFRFTLSGLDYKPHIKKSVGAMEIARNKAEKELWGTKSNSSYSLGDAKLHKFAEHLKKHNMLSDALS